MDWKKHGVTFAVIFLILGLVFLLPMMCRPRASQGSLRPPDARVVELSLEEELPAGSPRAPYSYVVRAEVADTKEKKLQGLSGRAALEPGYGMLYVYAEPQRQEFTEATTAFPVSVAFIREDGTIAEIHDAGARDPTAFAPHEAVKYVLEVRRGWFEDRGVSPGRRFRLPAEIQAVASDAPKGGQGEAP